MLPRTLAVIFAIYLLVLVSPLSAQKMQATVGKVEDQPWFTHYQGELVYGL